MFGPKIRVSQELMERLTEAANALGCASVEEFAEKVLSSEADRVLSGGSAGGSGPSSRDVEEIAKKLKGLGYLE